MTVAENIVLGAEPGGRAACSTRRPRRRGCASSPSATGWPSTRDAEVADITVGQQQRVEILRALYRGADILVLDEPTAVLTAQETKELFKILRSLREQGTSIVFITHKLNEVLDIADRVTVLRRGKSVGTVATAERRRGGARDA